MTEEKAEKDRKLAKQIVVSLVGQSLDDDEVRSDVNVSLNKLAKKDIIDSSLGAEISIGLKKSSDKAKNKEELDIVFDSADSLGKGMATSGKTEDSLNAINLISNLGGKLGKFGGGEKKFENFSVISAKIDKSSATP